MKKFFKEFKEFIAKGNVLDLAVGVIIGGAFSSIVTSLTDNIINPLINCIGGAEIQGKIHLIGENYIDYGAFISAIINFLLVAIVLFCIVKAFNKVKDANEAMSNKVKRIEFKVEKGIKLRKKEQEFYDAYKAQKEEEAKKAQEEASKPAPLSVSEELLTEIRDLLRNQKYL